MYLESEVRRTKVVSRTIMSWIESSFTLYQACIFVVSHRAHVNNSLCCCRQTPDAPKTGQALWIKYTVSTCNLSVATIAG